MKRLTMFYTELLQFLGTVTIKNELFAEHVWFNDVIFDGKENLPFWVNPYYRHLAGEYIFDTDVTVVEGMSIPNRFLYARFDIPMYVISLDTRASILFSRTNLLTHVKTAAAYKIGNPVYDSLCQEYPSQKDLIKAIAYSKHSAMTIANSRNLELLSCDTEVLAENERDSLMDRVRSILDVYRVRWMVREYRYEELYPMAMWSAMWMTLYLHLLVQRVTNLRTARVHPAHIWMYLTSRGLKDYRTILSLKQQLFLYRNIRYLLNNKGKDSNLRILDEALLREYGMTMRAKSMLLNTTESEPTTVSIPEIINEEYAFNKTPSQSASEAHEDLPTVIFKEHINRLEPEYNDEIVTIQKDALAKTSSTYLPTKLLEMNKYSLNTRFAELFRNFMLQSYLRIMASGRVNFVIEYQHTDEATPIVLTPNEVVALAYYCFTRSYHRRIKLTNVNLDELVGLIISVEPDPTRVVLTLENSWTYLGKTITIHAPDMIPTGCDIRMAHGFELDLPTVYNYHGSNESISWQIDMDRLRTDIPDYLDEYESAQQVIGNLDGKYKATLDHLIWILGSNCGRQHAAFETVYQRIMQPSITSLSLVDGYTSYLEWTQDVLPIRMLIEDIESSLYSGDLYLQVANRLMENVLPLTLSEYSSIAGYTHATYDGMRDLFVRLLSYNVALMDTDRYYRVYQATAPVVLGVTEAYTTLTTYLHLLAIRHRHIQHTTGRYSQIPGTWDGFRMAEQNTTSVTRNPHALEGELVSTTARKYYVYNEHAPKSSVISDRTNIAEAVLWDVQPSADDYSQPPETWWDLEW